jgi:acetate kinase
MTSAILVLNAGSSSLKFSLYRADARLSADQVLCHGQIEDIAHTAHFVARAGGKSMIDERIGAAQTHESVLAVLLRWHDRQFPEQELIAAGHRVVHGGARFTRPVMIDAAVLAGLRELIPLAPLHQPHHIAAIEALSKLHPTLPQIACFDTAFHHSQPEVATSFAIPRHLTRDGIRRFGFHGLSYEYIASALPDYLGEKADGRVIILHLGAGASMCAMQNRRSVATTMSFTPLDGLPMGTRCGALDPAVVLYLIQEKGMTPDQVRVMLYQSSGMLGVSEISDDMRTLLASDDARAREAVDLFVYRIGREIGSLAAAMQGLDALVFTAGIGEHSAEIRRRVLNDAAWLGVTTGDQQNSSGPELTRADSLVSAWIIPTEEDLMVARHSWSLIGSGGGASAAHAIS